MGNVLFISDPHLGHRKIVQFTREAAHLGAFRGGESVEEHDRWVIEQCLKAKPNKYTLWWFMGDVAVDESKLELLNELPGTKRLILGNHDIFSTQTYLKYFHSVWGTIKKYGMWLSRVPMHPDELRGKPNVHGHCHFGPVLESPHHADSRYLNLAIDFAPNNMPVTLDYLRKHFKLEEKG